MDFTVIFYGLMCFVGASFTAISIYIGTISSRCVQQMEYKKDQERQQEQAKTDRHNCKNECHSKLITLESKMIDENNKVDNRYNDKIEMLCAQNKEIIEMVGNVSTQIAVLQTEMMHLKRGE